LVQEETGISCVEEGHVVEGLYRETTCIRYPTLAILNLTDVNAPWVQADIQSRYKLDSEILTGEFFVFFMYFIQHLLHLPPRRFHCVGGCWDRIQDCCDVGIVSQTL
jgi:hypothetical protein